MPAVYKRREVLSLKFLSGVLAPAFIVGSRGRLIDVASLGKPACLARHQSLAHIFCFTAAYVRLEDVLYLCTGIVDSI